MPPAATKLAKRPWWKATWFIATAAAIVALIIGAGVGKTKKETVAGPTTSVTETATVTATETTTPTVVKTIATEPLQRRSPIPRHHRLSTATACTPSALTVSPAFTKPAPGLSATVTGRGSPR
jgi:hypothetical protein